MAKTKKENTKIEAKTYSPEYSKGYAINTNYDLSILRWGLKTLIEMDNKKGGKDELHTQWQDILQNLIPFPANESGYIITQDVPIPNHHRHYSHLLMIYPFTKSTGIRRKIIISLKNPLIRGKAKPEALRIFVDRTCLYESHDGLWR